MHACVCVPLWWKGGNRHCCYHSRQCETALRESLVNAKFERDQPTWFCYYIKSHWVWKRLIDWLYYLNRTCNTNTVYDYLFFINDFLHQKNHQVSFQKSSPFTSGSSKNSSSSNNLSGLHHCVTFLLYLSIELVLWLTILCLDALITRYKWSIPFYPFM